MSTIVQLKLTSGSEIVGVLETQDENNVYLVNPLEIERVLMTPNVFYTMKSFVLNQFEEEGEVPDVKMPINRSTIITKFNSTEKVRTQYEGTIKYLKTGEFDEQSNVAAEGNAEFDDDFDFSGDSDNPGNLLVFPGSDKMN